MTRGTKTSRQPVARGTYHIAGLVEKKKKMIF